ncbi:nitrate reductase molybdenum cofactor assembly chaperone [Streptomyces sp. SID3343]|uniref:nitrate reductase molybdenum cofactor assembly chaperone n=1 Tax=Streptomyces sp. SID3343 TaxID=2690260 RepID=UPI00136F2B66|nr:nitrate reductase molybdenum cofactor assembly chaperone [Streptomyces sp. SID3343]MYW04690.1 nitrate reductase molybdenum cofactor assembly chaperone [Streptomyces sp. SID3343]
MTHPAVCQAASLLLQYPDTSWNSRLETVRTALTAWGAPEAEPLLRFCARVDRSPETEFAARYVATFDRSRRRTLHLTYYTDGDTRRRGMSLADLKARYRAHGWACPPDELPDFLPTVLEFTARCPGPGQDILLAHRAGIALLGHALEAFHSPYADVVRAVDATLPGAGPADRRAALALARTGPPVETVGLEPFAAGGVTPPTEGARR